VLIAPGIKMKISLIVNEDISIIFELDFFQI